ncbi:cysteinyl-tRNA synthetase-like protein, partial [Trifolium pratense]
MSDDLQTPVILTGALQEALKFVNSSSKMLKKKMQKKTQLQLVQSLLEVEKEVRKVLNVLGLLSSLSYAEVLQQFKEKALKRAGLTEDEVLNLIEERRQARINKDFAKSDEVRTGLTEKEGGDSGVGEWQLEALPVAVIEDEDVIENEEGESVDEKAEKFIQKFYQEMRMQSQTTTTAAAAMAEERVELRLYNSMTREKDIFNTKVPGEVSMYVCGITAYDYSHLGHARAAVSFDILYRYLKHLGYEVTYVRNFTDVDDK